MLHNKNWCRSWIISTVCNRHTRMNQQRDWIHVILLFWHAWDMKISGRNGAKIKIKFIRMYICIIQNCLPSTKCPASKLCVLKKTTWAETRLHVLVTSALPYTERRPTLRTFETSITLKDYPKSLQGIWNISLSAHRTLTKETLLLNDFCNQLNHDLGAKILSYGVE